ncbi:MAG: hypothetical protein FWH26_02280 [Oscillospiraceae bacterium]|nr:hypothetical protein [Oscillospiraceae bacterium]
MKRSKDIQRAGKSVGNPLVRAIAAVAAPILVLGAAAACGGKKDYGGLPYFDEFRRGWRLLATDPQGNTVTNSDGKLVELVTNRADGYAATAADGKQITLVSEYPCFYHKKTLGQDWLELADFIVKIPKGWEHEPDRNMILNEKDTGDRLQYIPRKDVSFEELRQQMAEREENFLGAVNEVELSKESLTLFGKEALLYRYDVPVPVPGQEEIRSYVNVMLQLEKGCLEINYMAKSAYHQDKLLSMIQLIEQKSD